MFNYQESVFLMVGARQEALDSIVEHLLAYPAAQNNPSLQDSVCRLYGLSLADLTDDEARYIEQKIMRKRK